ncbi:MAG: hypothetical protein ABRQ25_15880 [Clostridiaceae bacterium]
MTNVLFSCDIISAVAAIVKTVTIGRTFPILDGVVTKSHASL